MIEPFINLLNTKGYDLKNRVILDIGSRDCIQSLEFNLHCPNSTIIAFECNKLTLDKCRSNIAGFSNIILIDKAVNVYNGHCTFFPIDPQRTITTWEDGNPGASSLFKATGKYPVETYVQNEEQVECTRIDTIITQNNIHKVDLVWMDLQGAEKLAIESFGKFIHNVDYIHTEVSFQEMYHGQVLYDEFNELMLSYNFVPVNRVHKQGWQTDIIYMNKKLQKCIL